MAHQHAENDLVFTPGWARRPSLSTRLTREYGVRYPFVSAGMGFVSYPPLVTAVCNAGGIGVLGNAVSHRPARRRSSG